GLVETVKLAKSAYPKSGGVVNGNVDATGSISGRGVYEYPSIRVYSAVNKPSPGELGAYTTGDCDRQFQLKGSGLLSIDSDNVRFSGHVLAWLDEVSRLIDVANNIPVGAPIPWPQPNPPSGYLTCNGQSFNKYTYPKLAVAYPSGRLPDLRGEFIRGWDDGRGVDHGRGILSWQPQQVQWHQHLGGHGGRAQGAFGVTNLAGHPGSYRDDAQQTLPFTNNGSDYQGFTNSGAVGNETRPRNIAFNYIVRAA
ncbi:tail fiber protein, partial [Photorhabdus luminescens]